MIKVDLQLSASWVLSRKNEKQLPVSEIIGVLKENYNAEIIYSGLTECEALINADVDDKNVLRDSISELICQMYDLKSDSGIYTLTVSEYIKPEPDAQAEAESIADAKSENDVSDENCKEKTPAEPENKNSVIERIEALVGAEEFKELARECVKVAPGIRKYGTFEAFTHRCYLISVNDGYGLSEYLSLFAELLAELKLFECSAKNKTAEVRLLPPKAGSGMENPFASALSLVKNRGNSRVISIDISDWMSETDDKEFRDFLKIVDDYAGSNIVFFRVPFVEKNVLRELHGSLNDILFIRDISIVPFDAKELEEFAAKNLSGMGFSMDDEAWNIFRDRITEEKNDGRFYGINTVNKVMLEMIYRKQLYNAESGTDNSIIRKCEILNLVEDDLYMKSTGLQMLDELVGMNEVKKKVEEIIAQIEASLENEELGYPCIHMQFVGNPGTGKTTVARIIGKILKEKGILRNGSFFEHSGRDFCGRYVGETAPKTAAMCRDAYGSVLFIDEAYSLYRGDSLSNADYGREAIDTLVAEMENHRNDLMVIMAGYPDDMDKLMSGNVGLKSRMPYRIDFPNYTKEQLSEIFLKMAGKSFEYDSGFENAVNEYFGSLSDELLNTKDFSNARFVRNLFERTWGKAVLRCQMAQIKCTSLTAEDFGLASSEKEFRNVMMKKSKPIGFI